MSWAKLDDRFHENRKVKRVWHRCPAALGLHVMAITYCAGHETDGFVDHEFVEEKVPKDRDRDRAVATLVSAGLWHEIEDGWQIHDFLEFNPSREQASEVKKAKSEAGKKGADARWRRGKGMTDAKAPAKAPAMAAANGTAMADDAPDPTRTHTTPPSPPRGGRRRDVDSFKEAFASWAAEHFPGIEVGYVQHAVRELQNRGTEPTVEAMRPEVAKWTAAA